MGKLVPMINKQTKQLMIFDALVALDDFQKIGNREEFKDWQKKWTKELDLIEESISRSSKCQE